MPTFYPRIKALVKSHNVGLIHVNHESFALTGYLLARSLGLPWIAHVRTTLTPGWFARRICRLIARQSAHAICIVEPVKQHFLSLAGRVADPGKISVVNNIARKFDASTPRSSVIDALPGRFRVLSLTNFSPNRGVDRIIDVADVLKSVRRPEFCFLSFWASGQYACDYG